MAKLEERVGLVFSTWTAVLASGAFLVAALGAGIGLWRFSDTLNEINKQVSTTNERLARVETRVDSIGPRLDDFRERLQRLETRLVAVESRSAVAPPDAGPARMDDPPVDTAASVQRWLANTRAAAALQREMGEIRRIVPNANFTRTLSDAGRCGFLVTYPSGDTYQHIFDEERGVTLTLRRP